MVQWQLQQYSSSEEDGFVNICAILSQPTERSVSFLITSAPGTASSKYNICAIISKWLLFSQSLNTLHCFQNEGTDFNEISTVRIVAAGTTESCIDVIISDDSLLEGAESFTVSLGFAGDQSVDIGPISSTMILIFDNDGMYILGVAIT